MGVQAKGMILPPSSIPRIRLEGLPEPADIHILGPTDSWEWAVQYPDGKIRHHQANDVVSLLQKVDGHLRSRYAIDEFKFLKIPTNLSADEVIQIGDIKHG